MKLGNKGIIQITIVGVIIIALAIGVVSGFMGYGPMKGLANWGGGQTAAAGQAGTAGAGQPDATVGLSTTSPQLDVVAFDIQNPGTSVGIGVYYIRNGRLNYDTDGLDLDVSPDDEIEFLVNATGWYSVHSGDLSQLSTNKGTFLNKKYTVPYDENPEISVAMKDYTTTPTLQFFSEDDDTLNTAAATEAITAGDIPNIRTKIIGDFEDYIQDAVYWCSIDATYFDDVTTNLGNAQSSLVPAYYVSNDTILDKDKGAWLVGDIVSTQTVEFVTTIDVDDSSIAGAGMLANGTHCHLDDRGWYVDENSKPFFKYGLVDEDDANVDQRFFNITLYLTAS